MNTENVGHPVRTLLRVLTFRATADDFAALGSRHLILGLACTWLVGAGRHWDNPRVAPWEKTGLGSVAYVFVLAAVFFVFLLALRPRRSSFANLVTFIALTSPPGLLYAIPVERLVDLAVANSVNAWFLAIVATWRVALLLRYLFVHAGLRWPAVLVGAFLPLCLVVTTLWVLNLDRVVFDFMSGMADTASPHAAAYGVLGLLTLASIWLVVPLLLAYVALAVHAHRRRSTEESPPAPEA